MITEISIEFPGTSNFDIEITACGSEKLVFIRKFLNIIRVGTARFISLNFGGI